MQKAVGASYRLLTPTCKGIHAVKMENNYAEGMQQLESWKYL